MEVYRCTADILAAGQRGRRKESGDSPLHHHPLAAEPRGTGRAAHHALNHPTKHWYRTHRRHHRRPVAGIR